MLGVRSVVRQPGERALAWRRACPGRDVHVTQCPWEPTLRFSFASSPVAQSVQMCRQLPSSAAKPCGSSAGSAVACFSWLQRRLLNQPPALASLQHPRCPKPAASAATFPPAPASSPSRRPSPSGLQGESPDCQVSGTRPTLLLASFLILRGRTGQGTGDSPAYP